MNLTTLPNEAFAPNLPDGIQIDKPAERTTPAAVAVMPGADLVIGDFQGQIDVDAGVVAAMDRVRLFHQPTTGYDRVDAEALAAAGIPLTNAGRATSIAMGEYVVMACLALLKSLLWQDARVRAGEWPQHDVVARSLVDLQHKTVGLVGLGAAGEEAARRLRGFDCRVLYTARSRRDVAVEESLGVHWVQLDELLAESDVVCLLVSLNPSTQGLVDAAALARMKPSAFLVNPARGGVVDEDALVEALRERRIAGAALDVFAVEPLPAGSPLRDLDNVILTPHTGGATLETRLRMLSRSFEVLTQAANGELPAGVVNGVTALRLP